GIHDYFIERTHLKHIAVIGPQKKGALLEGSKDFSKQFMLKHGIPTAASRSFQKEAIEEAYAYLDQHALPIVLKADGLAAGKGVLICTDRASAKTEIHAMLAGNKFGEAGQTVVVEEFLSGVELSVF